MGESHATPDELPKVVLVPAGASVKAPNTRAELGVEHEFEELRARVASYTQLKEELATQLAVARAERNDAWRDCDATRAELNQAWREIETLRGELEKAQTWMPPGHFYSPVPGPKDIQRETSGVRDHGVDPLLGIDMRPEHQLALLKIIETAYAENELPDVITKGRRYYADNEYYPFGDALVLQAFMQHEPPKRLIEIGSGFSSALILDTVDRYLDGATRCTFVEPYPVRIDELLRDEDRERHEVLVQQVQDVPLRVFEELERGDILVIDSSHVSKAGSDVNFLFFEVLPRLAPGVRIHVHDVPWPFTYPVPWLDEGRAWNESFLLRAFLQFNSAFEVEFCMSYALLHAYNHIKVRLPRVYAAPGTAFWIRSR